ncbi:protein MAIN-LIKE 1-like [Cajanus cajan]|uniref:protein MAIN-LIKE 1-like n=1 Tax=Cajanus cajan TaxID=3821 RepID=UPI00098DA6CF|nr:protein MAIN-LIKE 1-like [Cajanus cajan]
MTLMGSKCDFEPVLFINQYMVHIWNGAGDRVLKVRRATQIELHDAQIPDDIRDLLQRVGFLGVAPINYFPVDNHLISALVERWRPKTHTFHMPFDECTITLEDVAMLLGLKISGAPITGYATMDWAGLVQRLLGITPPESVLVGCHLRMNWIERHFSNVSEHIARSNWNTILKHSFYTSSGDIY